MGLDLPGTDAASAALLPRLVQVAPGITVPIEELSIMERLALMPEDERVGAIRSLAAEYGDDILIALEQGAWELVARPKQLLPRTGWFECWALAGRGFGKTLMGSQWVLKRVRDGDAHLIALVARAAPDVRDTIVEKGPSSLMMCARPNERPAFEPSKRRLVFPNGAMATTYSAEQPDALRGPQQDTAWCDEIASWTGDPDDVRTTYLLPGTRLGNPQILYTTTPKPIPTVVRALTRARKEQEAIERDGYYQTYDGLKYLEAPTRVVKGTTYHNAANLSPSFMSHVVGQFAGTRLGRQELLGEVLMDVPEALWSETLLNDTRVEKPPSAVEMIVVGVDPSVGDGSRDECGIVVVGLGYDNHLYVLEDASMSAPPHVWAAHVARVAEKWGAHCVVVERNQGGQLVVETLKVEAPLMMVEAVWASVGKRTRAEPVAQLFELGRAHIVGRLSGWVLEDTEVRGLEEQLCSWNPFESRGRQKSPDRLDALVWASTFLIEKMAEGSPDGGFDVVDYEDDYVSEWVVG